MSGAFVLTDRSPRKFGQWTIPYEEVFKSENGLYDARAFGAIGDGQSHPLSTKYNTLSQAQSVYDFAISLTDELDWCGITKAMNTAKSEGYARTSRWWAGGTVMMPGTYLITRPLLRPSCVRLLGTGLTGSVLKKTTNTYGVGAPTYNGVTDSFASTDAIIILDHGDDGYNAYGGIENISMWNTTGAGAMGIFASRATNQVFRNVQIEFCKIGLTGFTWWVNNLEMVTVNLPAAGTRGIGCVWDTVNWPGTSTNLKLCYVLGTTATAVCRGYEFERMAYMSLDDCACDGLGSDSYPAVMYYFGSPFTTSLKNCGAEGNTGEALSAQSYLLSGRQMSVEGMDVSSHNGVTAGTTGMLNIVGTHVSFKNCKFGAFATPRNSYNMVLDDCQVKFENCVEPSGGAGVLVQNTVGLGALDFVRADKDADLDYDSLTSTSWDGDSYSTGTGTINWNSVFGVPTLAKAVLVQAIVNDSGSAASTVSIILKAKSGTSTSSFIAAPSGLPNDTKAVAEGVVPIAADGTSYYSITASGASTFDVILRVKGWYL